MMRNALPKSAAALVLAAAALFSSCTQDMEGIFYSLEKEIKVPDNSLNNDISVVGIVKATLGGVDYYLAAAGSVFYRGTGEVEWHKLKNPIADSVATDIEVDGANNVVAGFSNGGAHGLYKLSNTSPPAYTAANIYSAKQVFRLFKANNRILASVGMNEAEAELYYIDAAAGTAAATDLPAGRWIRGATYDGTNFVACSSTSIYSSTVNPPLTGWGQAVYSAPGVSPLRDVYYNGTSVYLSAKYNLLRWTGAAWTAKYDTGYDFTLWNTINGVLVVGTDGSGYREVNAADLSIITPPGNFIRIPNLLYSAVIATLADAATNSVFFGTSANGLWRGNYTNVSDPSWSQE